MLTQSLAFAQAPQSANLWRVATTSLTTPAALQAGPAGVFWNPAANMGGADLASAVQFVQTSDLVGLTSLLAGVSKRIGGSGRVGIASGRTDVKDLVRTSSSPTSLGTIPVYTQYLGVSGQYERNGLTFGGLVSAHDARFDTERDNGVTVDLGARYSLSRRMVVAAATHFLPARLGHEETTDFYLGGEIIALDGLRVGRVAMHIIGRYGATLRAGEALEHMGAVGMEFGRHFRLDASLVRETGYQTSGWRPALGVCVSIGKYRLSLARSEGLNDLGGTYRVGLDATVLP